MTEQQDQPIPETEEQAQHRAELEAEAAQEAPPAPAPGASGTGADESPHLSAEQAQEISKSLVNMGLDSLQGAHPALIYGEETRARMTGALAPVVLKYDGALPPIVMKYKEELWLLANVAALGYSSVMAVKHYDQAHANQDPSPDPEGAPAPAYPGAPDAAAA